jgi:hypothetical protein
MYELMKVAMKGTGMYRLRYPPRTTRPSSDGELIDSPQQSV